MPDTTTTRDPTRRGSQVSFGWRIEKGQRYRWPLIGSNAFYDRFRREAIPANPNNRSIAAVGSGTAPREALPDTTKSGLAADAGTVPNEK